MILVRQRLESDVHFQNPFAKCIASILRAYAMEWIIRTSQYYYSAYEPESDTLSSLQSSILFW